MPTKMIALPATGDGYYRLGDLPELIAEAAYPESEWPDSLLISAVIWRDDGTDCGQYFECAPRGGAPVVDFERADDWSVAPIELTESERREHATFRWANARWHEQRNPAELRRYWPDGGLVVTSESTQADEMYGLKRDSERTSFRTRLYAAAQLQEDAPGYLPVVDSNENNLTFRHGAALESGWVHIDWLNKWGKSQHPENVFFMKDASALAAQRPARTDEYDKQLQERIADIANRYIEAEIKADRHPSKLTIAEYVARQLKEQGVRGKGRSRGPLSATYIKRHYLEGISTAESRRLSTSIRRGK